MSGPGNWVLSFDIYPEGWKEGWHNERNIPRLWVGRPLPAAYVTFLRETNGAELGKHDQEGDCLQLWSAEEIPEDNQGYQIQKYLPGTFAIGSDGEPDAILLDMTASEDPDAWPVIRVAFGDLDRDEFRPQASSFGAWADLEFRLIARF